MDDLEESNIIITLNGESLTESDYIKIRTRLLELATQVAIANGKPSFAPYIAHSYYEFVLSGRKPETASERRERELDERIAKRVETSRLQADPGAV